MDKIYKNYSDVPVAAYVIYAKSAKACADAAGNKQLKTSELKEMFLKGAVVDTGNGNFAKPVSFTISNSIGKVGYIIPNSSTATSADIATISAIAD